jgi:hypothetical protein
MRQKVSVISQWEVWDEHYNKVCKMRWCYSDHCRSIQLQYCPFDKKSYTVVGELNSGISNTRQIVNLVSAMLFQMGYELKTPIQKKDQNNWVAIFGYCWLTLVSFRGDQPTSV